MDYIPFLILCSGCCIFLAFYFHSFKKTMTFFKRFIKEESGAAYSISFLLTLPVYMFFMCLVIELTFTLTAKMGTIHAAHAAVRAAAVYNTVNRPDERGNDFLTDRAKKKAHKAAILAIVPFSSGSDNVGTASQDALDYCNAYNAHLSRFNINNPVNDSYVLRRYQGAEKRIETDVAINSENTDYPWKQNLVATVSYSAPFRIPYIGYILGGSTVDGKCVLKLTEKGFLPIELPYNDTGFLGVPVMSDDQIKGE